MLQNIPTYEGEKLRNDAVTKHTLFSKLVCLNKTDLRQVLKGKHWILNLLYFH